MDINRINLIDAILESWTKCLQPPYGDGTFSPEDGQTDCNRFVNLVCFKMGYEGFAGLLANQIYDKLGKERYWSVTDGENAIYYANKGLLVLAAWKNPNPEKSGHVAVVRPGNGGTSAKWGYKTPLVPKVANVGPAKSCRLDRGANWAFGEEPKYFVLKAVAGGQ